MIYIKKGTEPKELTEYKRNNRGDSDFGFDGIGMPKNIVRTSLLREQGYLCAYCMRRIEDSANKVKIEHYVDRKTCSDELDYNNLLAVCNGDYEVTEYIKNIHAYKKLRKEPLTCDSAKGNKSIVINPQTVRDMDTIQYIDGQITICGNKCTNTQQYDDFTNSIRTLNLNQKFNHIGYENNAIDGNLIHTRRTIYSELREGLKGACKKGSKKAVSQYMKKIDKMAYSKNSNGEFPSFVGIYRDFVKRHKKYLTY